MSTTAENVTAKTAAPPVEPPKERRGPGRPRKEGGASNSASAKPAASERPTKRKGKVSFDDEAKSALGAQILGLHNVAALATGIPEIVLSQKEADALGIAIANVCEEYDLSLDGKTGAALQLAAACGMIYIPRYFVMMARIKKQREEFEARTLNGAAVPHADATTSH